MAKQTKKHRHTKKRKAKHKRQKARRQSLPKILRQDPLLREALYYHHPLKECLISKNWETLRIATILCMALFLDQHWATNIIILKLKNQAL